MDYEVIENGQNLLEKNCIINHLNLTINKGDKIAFLGSNGSGKTTLLKIIIGLYEISSGDILLNGTKTMTPLYLRIKTSIVFQDYQIFSFSIAENILLHPVRNKSDENQVLQALEKVYLRDKVCKLKDGIYTCIGKEFSKEGEVFSGGEMQRLALARIFASDAQIIILDEPTTGLSSDYKNLVLENIINYCKEKTLIVVTHEMELQKKMDVCYRFNDGQLLRVI